MEHLDETYLCIDLKCFYASVECVARGLDPFETNLVVADHERSRTTICLAISPAMKKIGVKNRCCVFEIPEGISYIMAKPRMRRYMEVSAGIVGIYLRFVSAEDIHVYSIDECFIYATPYLKLYSMNAKEFAQMLMEAVRTETGICATAGIGTNLFLAKVALDITAKHCEDNIGMLDERSFIETLWDHRPLTDFWNIGPGIARRLEKYGVRDLKGIASLDQHLLYKEFGANAEFLIDHAWGQEPCTIAEIKQYEPRGKSMVNGQVLPADYTAEETRLVLHEMIDASALDLVEQGLAAGHVSLSVGYAKSTCSAESAYGARGAFHAGGSKKLGTPTRLSSQLRQEFDALFDECVFPDCRFRRISIGLENLVEESEEQQSLFEEDARSEKEKSLQKTALAVRGKFGKNALLKGMSLKEKSTAIERNNQIGGHHA